MINERQVATEEALAALIATSLAVWKRPGDVRHEAPGKISVETVAHSVEIRRAKPGAPFRWLVAVDGRQRHASSIPGVLRMLRTALDDDYKPSRVRIAPFDLVGS